MLSPQLRDHYGSTDISARIRAALNEAGVDFNTLTRSDLTPFDEFHGGGIHSTRDLARFAGVNNVSVLDVGCGIGGPARTLAAEFDCTVTGVDLTPAFVDAARMLTDALDMNQQCSFEVGDAGRLPAQTNEFDYVWSQNMLMNVADKAAFFAEVARVLKPGGGFAFECVLAGNGAALHFPTFWAATAAMNHLVTLEELEQLLAETGFKQLAFEDTTEAVIAQGHKRRKALSANKENTPNSKAKLNIGVIVPDEVETKMNNAIRNNVDGCTRTIKAHYQAALA